VTDWVAWHEEYRDPTSPLARRAVVVRELVGEAVAAHRGRSLCVLGLCAGDGGDLLPALGEWRDRKLVSGRLLELEPTLVDRARAALLREQLDGLEAVCGDAGRPSNYAGVIPADLVTACGIFGNISDDDVRRLIGAMCVLCARDGGVIWTRHRRRPDLTPAIRGWFADAGFRERTFISPGPDEFAVGWHQLTAEPQSVTLPASLFTFVR
jgi:hypothetical protein